jgi:hypothetical protein
MENFTDRRKIFLTDLENKLLVLQPRKQGSMGFAYLLFSPFLPIQLYKQPERKNIHLKVSPSHWKSPIFQNFFIPVLDTYRCRLSVPTLKNRFLWRERNLLHKTGTSLNRLLIAVCDKGN